MFHDSVIRIISNSGHQLSDFSDICPSINKHKFDLSKLPVIEAFKLSNKLNCSIENLVTGNVDFNLATSQLMGNKLEISSKYDSYNGSIVRTIANVLEFADSYFGNCSDYLKKKFQLSEKLLTEGLDSKVNGKMLLDIFKSLPSNDFKALYLLGLNLSQNYKDSHLKLLSSHKLSPRQLYEEVNNNIKHVTEKNLDYSIEYADNDRMIATTKINPALSEAIKEKTFGDDNHSANIIGWYSGINMYLYDQPAIVKKVSCSYSGDPICRYEIDYSHIKKLPIKEG